MSSLVAGTRVAVPFNIPQTELLAGTSTEVVAPFKGYIEKLLVIVQTEVTTGGPITVETEGDAVTGLTVTVANGATKGTVYQDGATVGGANRDVEQGDRIEVIPDASFATAGAVSGFLIINSADLSPALPAA